MVKAFTQDQDEWAARTGLTHLRAARALMGEAGTRQIENGWGPQQRRDMDRAIALLDAAPDVLKALRDLTEWGRTHTTMRDENSPHHLLIAAVAAIAKVDDATPAMPPLTPREQATILAALRLWQARARGWNLAVNYGFDDIASNDGEPLTGAEIDALAARMGGVPA